MKNRLMETFLANMVLTVLSIPVAWFAQKVHPSVAVLPISILAGLGVCFGIAIGMGWKDKP